MLWALIDADAFGTDATTGEERLQLSCLHIRRDIFQWYKDYHGEHPEESITRLGDWTSKMLGSRNSSVFKPKGAETWAMLLWSVDLLRRFGHKLAPNAVRGAHAADDMVRYIRICQQCPLRLSAALIQEHSPDRWSLV